MLDNYHHYLMMYYPIHLMNFYESKGWKVGQTPMKNWRSAVVTWEKKQREQGDLFQRTPQQRKPGF